MKNFYFTFFLISFSFSAFAQSPVNTFLKTSGDWDKNSNWSLNRKPQAGDSIIIPAGRQVNLKDEENLNSAKTSIRIYGTLNLRNTLRLHVSSFVITESNGSIINGNQSDDRLYIGGALKHAGSTGDVLANMIADSNTGVAPDGFRPATNIELPVVFIGFNVARQGNSVLIQWSTAQEMNSSHFEIQRSENGTDWSMVFSVAAAGNSSSIQSYSYTDRTATGKTVYYRIRQVDIDGHYTVTPIRMIKLDNLNAEIKINASTPNSIYVHFSNQVKANVRVMITNLNGQVIAEKSVNNPLGQVILPYQNAGRGIYVITVTDGLELRMSKQVLL